MTQKERSAAIRKRLSVFYRDCAIPKGRTTKQLRDKAKRDDAKQLRAFRVAVWMRESRKVDNFELADIARCEHCGTWVHRWPGDLTGEVHHRISRRHKATRYDPANGVLLCNHLVNNCHDKAERGEIQV